jgi:UDP-N-acetylglucosamine--dolichyl-phosphate N-acetylglucosaminephosphotransferase
MNKYNSTQVAEAGGIAVIIGICFGLLIFIFIKTFYLAADSNIIFIFSLITAVLLIGFIGFVDDILGWKVGLKQKHKFLLTIPVALPIVVVNAGHSMMNVPFLGNIDFGILYPLLLIPIGIIGASNGFNMLAGFNGLEAGMGIIILSALGYIAWSRELYWILLLVFICVASLLAFLVYNMYPAKIFPGDSLTYTLGTIIATIAIFGNMEKAAILLFIPYIIEFILKSRAKLKAECFGVPDQSNMLSSPSRKCYSLTHVILNHFPKVFRRNLKEYEVVSILYIFELFFVYLALVV